MNKTSYSKRGLAAFSALLICAILLSLTLTNLFSSKAEETAASGHAKRNTQASDPFSLTTNNYNNTNAVYVTQPNNTAPAQPINDPAPSNPVPGQIVIQFSADSSEQERAAYVESLGGTVLNTIAALDTVTLSVPEEIAQEPLPASAIVEQAEQAHFVSALDTVPPDDPNYTSQWALTAINASSAWAQIPADTPIITVAVIDTGICSAHEDLIGRISAGWDFIENDATPQDANGHGCFVSGLIAANINNGIGVAGVAPNTRIMPLRVLDARGSGTDVNVAQAIVYAADNGAQVINLSLGGSEPSSAMENAVNYAVAKGVSVVAAAGNNGALGALYPARYAAAIAVGSLDSNMQHSSFSNYGTDVDIWAPGGSVMSTNLNGGYGSGSGTSFAAPYVAGAQAIDLALNRTTSLTGGNLDLNPTLASDPVDDTGSIVTIASVSGLDNFSESMDGITLPYTDTLDTTSATIGTSAPADPSPTCTTGQNSHSVWYKYVAASTVNLHIDTHGSSYNTVVAVWTYAASTFTQIGCNDDDAVDTTSFLQLLNTASGTYYIEVMSKGTTAGGSLNLAIAADPPDNDAFGSAISIADTDLPYNPSKINTTVSSTETDDPMPEKCASPDVPALGQNSRSVWYKYTAAAPGILHVDTTGSNYDTVVALWTGSALNSLIEFACNNNEPSQPGTIIITSYLEQAIIVTVPTTYYIEVMSVGDAGTGGNLDFNFDYALNVVSNDEFANADVIPNITASTPYTKTQDTRKATEANTDPPLADCNRKSGLATVWYKYTPVSSGKIKIDTIGSKYDTILSVWTWVPPIFNSIVCNDDIDIGTNILQSSVVANVSGGVTYYIAIAQQNGKIDETNPLSVTGELDMDKSGDVSAQYVGGQMKINVSFVPVPTTFGSVSKWSSNFGLANGWTVQGFVRMVGDVNHDDRMDLVGFGADGVYVAIATGTGFGPVSKWSSSFGLANGWTVQNSVRTLGDVTGDGKTDLIGFGQDGVYVAFSTGSGFGLANKLSSSFGLGNGWTVSNSVRTLGDVTGDGKADLVGFGQDGVYVAVATGTGFEAVSKWSTGFGLANGWTVQGFVRTVGDVTGDGKADLVGFGSNGVYVAVATGTGFGAPTQLSSSFGLANGWTVQGFVRTVGDVTGDGKADLVGFGADGVYIAVATGSGFGSVSKWTSGFGLANGWTVQGFVRTVGDVNKDGNADLVGFGADGVYIALAQ